MISPFMAASLASAQQDWPKAFTLWRQAVEGSEQPTAEAWERLATAALHVGQRALAFAAIQQALTLDPTHAGRWFTLGAWYKFANQVEESRAAFLAAVREKPDYLEALVEAGNTYFGEGRYPEALACYAVAQQHEYCPEAVWNRSLIELVQGLMPAAWEGYEARWQSRLFREPRKRGFMDTLPEWNGKHTHHLLAHGEQGIGDHVQMLRYVPLIVPRVRQVTLVVRSELVTYTKHLLPDLDVIAWNDPPPADASAHHPLFSAPFLFQTCLLYTSDAADEL